MGASNFFLRHLLNAILKKAICIWGKVLFQEPLLKSFFFKSFANLFIGCARINRNIVGGSLHGCFITLASFEQTPWHFYAVPLRYFPHTFSMIYPIITRLSFVGAIFYLKYSTTSTLKVGTWLFVLEHGLHLGKNKSVWTVSLCCSRNRLLVSHPKDKMSEMSKTRVKPWSSFCTIVDYRASLKTTIMVKLFTS